MHSWQPSSRGIASIQELTELRAAGDFVVHVWAEWNGYDRAFDEKLRALAEQASIRVLSLNADERQFWELLRECNVTNVPALLVFRNGTHVQTIQNYDAQVALSEALRALQSATRLTDV